jgi:hypothetical protein
LYEGDLNWEWSSVALGLYDVDVGGVRFRELTLGIDRVVVQSHIESRPKYSQLEGICVHLATCKASLVQMQVRSCIHAASPSETKKFVCNHAVVVQYYWVVESNLCIRV